MGKFKFKWRGYASSKSVFDFNNASYNKTEPYDSKVGLTE